VLEEKMSKARHVISKALRRSVNPLVVWSGGKDSTLMAYLVMEVVRRFRFTQPHFLVGDPFPFPTNVNFLKRLITSLGVEDYTWYRDIIPPDYMAHSVRQGRPREECCFWLKVRAFNEWVKACGFDYVLVAIRWDEHPARAKEEYFSPREEWGHVRVHPILHFTWRDVLEFYRQHPYLLNPLYLRGYTSLGCRYCTERTIDAQFSSVEEYVEYLEKHKVEERAGRAQDKEKIMERLRKLGYF